MTFAARSILAALLAALLATPAIATQHLVSAGDPWEHLAARVRPGDEILLLPGVHRPAVIKGLRGTAAQPIVIRGLDPDAPPLIEANRYGLQFVDAYAVHVRNLRIRGAKFNGIEIERTTEDLDVGNLVFEDVIVEDTGPKGLRHAINAIHVDDLTFRRCLITGWAGSGIELVGCDGVVVESCRMIGRADHQQRSGVRARAGSRNVEILRCTFENNGDQGVCLGAGSDFEDFRPPLPEDADAGSRFEVERVTVARCVFLGGHCAVAFAHCSTVQIAHCTIVAPSYAIVSVRSEQTDPRFGQAVACNMDSNLITWAAGGIKSLTHRTEGALTVGVVLQDNLWWSSDLAERRDELGPLPGTPQFEQEMGLDPRLDENLHPTVEAAMIYGAFDGMTAAQTGD